MLLYILAIVTNAVINTGMHISFFHYHMFYNALINTGVHISFSTTLSFQISVLFYLDRYLEMELLDPMVVLFLIV